MEREQLLEVLKGYEKPIEGFSLQKNENNADMVQVLINDVNRIDFNFSSLSGNPEALRLLKNILCASLEKFPLKYIQGMAEVSSIIVLAYFYDIVKSPKTTQELVEASDDETPSHSFLYQVQDTKDRFLNLLLQNKEMFERMQTAIFNVLNTRFVVFFNNKFSLYKETNDAFIEMMRKEGVVIKTDVSFKYMNHILTFFRRIVDSEAAAYGIFRIVLTSDPIVLFSILAIFFENVQSGASSGTDFEKKVSKLPSDFGERVVKQHEKLLKARETVKSSSSKRTFLYCAAAAGALAAGAAIAYKYMDKK